MTHDHLNFFIQFCAHVNDEKRCLGKNCRKTYLHAYTFVLCQTSQKQSPNENTCRRKICWKFRNDLGKNTTNLWIILVKISLFNATMKHTSLVVFNQTMFSSKWVISELTITFTINCASKRISTRPLVFDKFDTTDFKSVPTLINL